MPLAQKQRRDVVLELGINNNVLDEADLDLHGLDFPYENNLKVRSQGDDLRGLERRRRETGLIRGIFAAAIRLEKLCK